MSATKLTVFSTNTQSSFSSYMGEMSMERLMGRLSAWLWGRDVNDVWYFIDSNPPFQITQFGGSTNDIVKYLMEKL